MVYNTLPFGWKASPFIYQSVGMCETVFKEICPSEHIIY